MNEPTDHHTATPPTTTLYVKPHSRQCDWVKHALDRSGVPFHIIDLTHNTSAATRIRTLGYTEPPVVETAHHHWTGIRPDHIRDLIEHHRHTSPTHPTGHDITHPRPADTPPPPEHKPAPLTHGPPHPTETPDTQTHHATPDHQQSPPHNRGDAETGTCC